MIPPNELMKQAYTTAHDYMNHAVFDIDEKFGSGYAKEHPELVGAYMHTAALDYLTSFGLQSISEEIRSLSDVLDK